jgi:hypothetical protein
LFPFENAVPVLGGERGAVGKVLVHDVAPVAAVLGDKKKQFVVLFKARIVS